MVLNFFQLKNHTSYSFDIVNTENSADNYTVGPKEMHARHDLWLAQGDGAKGASVSAYREGAVRRLLHLWDQDWAIHFRFGGTKGKIPVNGNKDFWIEVYDDRLEFHCYSGRFNGNESVRTLKDWKSLA